MVYWITTINSQIAKKNTLKQNQKKTINIAATKNMFKNLHK